MRITPYYSVRTNKNKLDTRLNINHIKRLFLDLFNRFDSNSYFQEAFGYECTDQGYCVGKIGTDIEVILFYKLRKEKLWPIRLHIDSYSEEDLFDMIEFCYDCISKPINGYHHAWNQCGWHYSEFDKSIGQEEFRVEIDKLLLDYETSYELSKTGNILKLNDYGLESLIDADIPECTEDSIKAKMQNSILKFRYFKSTIDDRKNAIRELADILEYLRPEAKKVISKKDEDDLFNLANNFGIRHHNKNQKNNYDNVIWYSWMFYYYLSTIHALLRLVENNNKD